MQDSERDWIDRFIRHLDVERRLSPLTQKSYRRDIVALADWCSEVDIDCFGDLDNGHLRQWAATSHRRGLGARSIQRRLSAVRTFFKYLTREKHVGTSPVGDVSAPKAPKRLPGNLDADRMSRLLAIEGKGPVVDRDRAILELLYSSGLRLAELVDLNLGEVDLADATVRVTGKGNKDRIVPVGRKAREALVAWQRSR